MLNKLSPYCESCGGKKLYFCIERCCRGPSSALCLECDSEHRLHRKNELKLLFLDHKLIKPHSLVMHESVDYLADLLREQKRRSEELIQKQVMIAKLYSKALKEVLQCLPTKEDEWLERAYEVVAKVYRETQPNKQVREEFAKYMEGFNLYPKCPFTSMEAFRKLVQALQDYSDNPLKMMENSTKSVLSTL